MNIHFSASGPALDTRIKGKTYVICILKYILLGLWEPEMERHFTVWNYLKLQLNLWGSL